MTETDERREPTMLDRQISALAEVHARNAGPNGPLDDRRRLAVIGLYVEWINEALADEISKHDGGER